jgi:WD40 repeat protein
MFAPLLGAASYNDVAAIFDTRCLGCHTDSVKMGSLSLQTWEAVQQGGTHGKIVVPGKSSESRLFRLIAGKDTPSMPMDGSQLSHEQIEMIRTWIDAGAHGPKTEDRPGIDHQIPLVKTVSSRIETLAAIPPRSAVRPRIFDLAFRPDGNMIAIAGHQQVRLMDAGAKNLLSVLAPHASDVRAVAFSPDGKLLAAAGGLPARAGEIRVWDVEQRRLLHILRGHTDCIYGVAFSPSGDKIATASYDKLVKLWDLASEKEIRTYKDHIDAVYAVVFTADGKRLVSGSADRSVKVWDVASGERLFTLSEPLDGINTVAIDPSGRFVAAGGLDKSIRIWSLEATKGVLVHSLIAHEDAILRLAWSRDGKELLSSSADKTVKLFRAVDLTELRSFSESDWVYGLQFSPDGKTIAIGRFDGVLTVTP